MKIKHFYYAHFDKYFVVVKLLFTSCSNDILSIYLYFLLTMNMPIINHICISILYTILFNVRLEKKWKPVDIIKYIKKTAENPQSSFTFIYIFTAHRELVFL